MESEVTTLKRRYLESRTSYKEMKREMREQRDRTRQIIAVCGSKLTEKENEVLLIRRSRDEELAKIARELLFLRSNMLKEQKRLENIINEQNETIRKQAQTINHLQHSQQQPSNIDVISQRHQEQELEQDTKIQLHHHHRVVTPISDMDTPTSSEDGGSPKSSFNKGPGNLLQSPSKPKLPPALPPRRNSSSSSTSSTGTKPPVPSRAGVNRKLQMNTVGTKRSEEGLTGDEGFCSSHEDRDPSSVILKTLNNNNLISPSRQLTNHRGVQKPSDIKYRSKLRSTSNLGALEEHQVITNAPITTVTYLDYF